MRWMRERLNKEEGFTLIELMVVVLIIAVLVAIAIPSFLGFRNRAEDRSAQADLRNSLLAEKAFWTDNGAYTANGSAELGAYEPSLLTNNTGAADAGVFIEYAAAREDMVCLSQESGSGSHFMVYDNATAGGGTFFGSSATAITCPTANPTATATVAWSPVSFQAVP
jgi:type IV pilus assembly protein PilA